MKKRDKTVGQAALELQQKAQQSPHTHGVEDQTREQLTDYEKNVLECAQTFKNNHPGVDFFVVVLTKAEKLLGNVIRNYFIGRYTCPMPNYDQTVFRYTHEDDNIRLVWTLPNRAACHAIIADPLAVRSEARQLVAYVLDFQDGTLASLAKRLNKEDELKTGIVLELKEGTA